MLEVQIIIFSSSRRWVLEMSGFYAKLRQKLRKKGNFGELFDVEKLKTLGVLTKSFIRNPLFIDVTTWLIVSI